SIKARMLACATKMQPEKANGQPGWLDLELQYIGDDWDGLPNAEHAYDYARCLLILYRFCPRGTKITWVRLLTIFGEGIETWKLLTHTTKTIAITWAVTHVGIGQGRRGALLEHELIATEPIARVIEQLSLFLYGNENALDYDTF